MKLLRDPVSFQGPLDRAVDDAVDAVVDAGDPVDGASARAQAALNDKRDLETFVERVGDLIDRAGFSDLPRLRRAGRVLPHCHVLTVGPWRGVFLADPAGDFAVALVFSKAPHAMDDRLDELVAHYRRQEDE